MLLKVPPHGCGLPWPETIERVAEWCGRDAGRRSAGIGSDGDARTHAHARGVRARGRHPRATRIPAEDVPGGDLRQ